VSLGAVREALSQLQAEGLVIAEAHRGYTATPISSDDLKDLTRVRVQIETLCLTWSMTAGKIEWESEVIGATHRLTKTYRVTDRASVSMEWIAAHDAYHYTLVSACGSPRLLQIRQQLYDQSERYRKLEAILGKERAPDDEHKQLADAVIERDVPRATQLLKAHITLTTDNILKAMETKQSKASRASGSSPGRRASGSMPVRTSTRAVRNSR
jgi:DNA-binding GntR family transcriptional regulator